MRSGVSQEKSGCCTPVWCLVFPVRVLRLLYFVFFMHIVALVMIVGKLIVAHCSDMPQKPITTCPFEVMVAVTLIYLGKTRILQFASYNYVLQTQGLVRCFKCFDDNFPDAVPVAFAFPYRLSFE